VEGNDSSYSQHISHREEESISQSCVNYYWTYLYPRSDSRRVSIRPKVWRGNKNVLTRTRIYLSLVITLIHRLAPRTTSNGLQHIVDYWQNPSDSTGLLAPWPEDFSRDIVPIPCHSHNDYTRRVPLYNALALGCTGVEADIFLRKDVNGSDILLVGHKSNSLKSDRSLQSLYLDPLMMILENQNQDKQFKTSNESVGAVGVFDTNANITLVLLIDFKSNGTELWPHVVDALEPLRQKGWLTHWNNASNKVTPGPLTVVGTGNTPFEAVLSNTTNRDIFFDAPLNDISNPIYNSTNSYYASVDMSKAIGTRWFGRFSSKQLDTIKAQISTAAEKGLKSRYWDTVGWPISWRDHTWNVLVNNGVGMLNVDDLVSSSRWNWDWCVVAGLVLCG
jgi:hypothetical protein